jgi:hypothetical protein
MTAADLTPGTRVIVQNCGHLSGQTGVVIEMAAGLLNGLDCAVAFEDREDVMCFYAHELAVEK